MISGIVVATKPENLAEVGREIEALDYAAVHYADPRGRLVVTIDAPGIEASMKRVEAIGRFRQVLSVSLAQYCLEGDEVDGPSRPRGDEVPPGLEWNRTPHDRSER